MNSYLTVNGQKLESLENEVWKNCGGSYYISNMGRLATSNWKNKNILRIMKPALDAGYMKTVIVLNGEKKNVKIHRLVAQEFLPNLNNLPQVNHKDFNTKNNCVENLEWCTAKYNTIYSSNAGRLHRFESGVSLADEFIRRGELNGCSILTEKQVLEIRAKFKPRKYTREMLAKEYGVKACTIKDVILRRSWAHVK